MNSRRLSTPTTYVLVLALCVMLTACPPPGGGGESNGSETDTGIEIGFCEGSLGPPDGTFAKRVTQPVEISEGVTEALCADILDLEAFGVPETHVFGVINIDLERPAFDDDSWPNDHFPVMVFVHGNRQLANSYDHLWDATVPQGLVVANIQSTFTSSPGIRAAEMLCVTRWLTSIWDEREEHLNCDLALAGHSNGGHAAQIVAKHLADNPNDPAALFSPKLLLGLAPKSADNDEFLVPAEAPPAVNLQGSIDNDVPGGALINYDLNGPEELGVADTPEKYVIWAYDVEHDAFGGGPSTINDANANVSIGEFYGEILETEAEMKGQTFAAEYVRGAVLHFLLGDDGEETLSLLRGESIPDSLAGETQWWDYLPSNPDGRAMIFSSFIPSLRDDPNSRVLVDTMSA
jgi:hypothetical protein